MKIIVNGEQTTVKDDLTVTELLADLQVKMPDMVSVEHNGEILRRQAFDSTVVGDGDRVEFLYFMGGGAS